MTIRKYLIKKCINCGEEFRYVAFKKKPSLDTCEKCSERIRKRGYYRNNPELYKELAKINREKHRDYYKNYNKTYHQRDYVKDKKAIYNKTNKGRESMIKSKLKYRYKNNGVEIDKLWIKNNHDKILKYKKKFRHSDKGLIAAINYQHRRRSWLGDGKVTKEEWEAVKLKFNNKCADCKKEIKLEMDHITPLSKGGVHHISNIQPLCRECNARKSNKIIGAIMPQQKL